MGFSVTGDTWLLGRKKLLTTRRIPEQTARLDTYADMYMYEYSKGLGCAIKDMQVLQQVTVQQRSSGN